MNEADFIAALRGHWIAAWAGPEAVVWEDDQTPDNPDAAWLRVIIASSKSQRRGIGRSREDNYGLVSVEVYAPKVGGPGPGERLASRVADTWRAFRHDRIKLDAPSVAGLRSDGAFNRHLITLGWRGDMRFA